MPTSDRAARPEAAPSPAVPPIPSTSWRTIRRRRTARSTLAVGLVGLVAVALATPAPAATSLRDPALHPFSVTSPANTSLGSGAKFEGSTSTKTAALLRGIPMINAEKWSIAVALAKSTDPVAKVTNIANGVVTYFRIPSGAQVTAGTDKHMTVVQPDHYTAYECYKMTQVGTTSWTTTYLVKTDLRTSGLAAGARASGISQAMGLIRSQEVKALKIPHTLALGIPNSMLKSGQIWPARKQDSDAATAYKGPIPMGTMVGIPPSVDLSKLGLTAEGLAVGRALQDYGAHVLVRAGTVALFAEPVSDAAAVQRMRTDYQKKLYPLLRVITNNTPTTVGGGGTRRQPAAAALAY